MLKTKIVASVVSAVIILVVGITAMVILKPPSVDKTVAPPTTPIGLLENRIAEHGQSAPDFRLNDLDMMPLRLSDLRGTPVVMNFFASWCAPCKVELPLLRAAHEQSQDNDYIVLGVSSNDRREAMEEFASEENLHYPIVIDGDNSVGIAYQVVGPPYTFFIDREGIISAVISGELDQQSLDKNIVSILN